MKLEKLQSQLDFKKRYESELAEKDMSGKMGHCDGCKYRVNESCTATQEQQEIGQLCALNFNKGVKVNDEIGNKKN